MKEFNYKLPKKTNKKRRILISLTVCVLSVLIAVSYALFMVIGKDRFINTEVAPFVVSAPAPCFNFNGVTGEIVGYYANEDNDPSKPACPMNVKVPDSINGQIVKKLGNYLFNGLGFTAVEIPNTVTSIGDYALANNNIRDLVIPDSVTSIGVASFQNSGIETVVLSNNLTAIPRFAFDNNRLTTVSIPASVTILDWASFRNNLLETIDLSYGLKVIGNQSLHSNNLTSINIPASVNNIEPSSFSLNQLPNDQAFIYKRNADGSVDDTTIIAYGGAEKDNVIIPSQVTTIYDWSMISNRIKKIVFPSNLKYIGDGALAGNNLTDIQIPSSVTYVGSRSFNNNRATTGEILVYARKSDGTKDNCVVSYAGMATDIIIPEGVTKIADYTFQGLGLTSVSIPSSVTYVGKASFISNSFPDSTAFIYNRNADGTVNYESLNSYAGNNTSVVIPEGIKIIDYDAFKGVKAINNLTFPSTLLTIKTSSFASMNISNIVIPSSVKTIESSAFQESNINNLVLGDGVESIGQSAFFNNNITSVTIPSSVLSIGNEAFRTNPLTEVKIKGKSSPSDFTTYGTNIFTWRAGYSDANITWNAS